MVLLACLGLSQCQHDFRALSCQQFPFFPYVSADYRFLGLAYEWEFEKDAKSLCQAKTTFPTVASKWSGLSGQPEHRAIRTSRREAPGAPWSLQGFAVLKSFHLRKKLSGVDNPVTDQGLIRQAVYYN